MNSCRDLMSEDKNQTIIDTTRILPQYSDSYTSNELIRVPNSIRGDSNQKRQKKSVPSIIIGVLIFFSIVIGTAFIPSSLTDIRKSNPVEGEKRKKKRITRLALLRPFGMQKISSLSDSFDEWNNYLPCDYTFQHDYYDDEEVIVDIFLSFSQNFERNADALKSAEEVLDMFLFNRNSGKGGWARCFRNFYLIETNIDASKDLYLPMEAETNQLWVNGPNQQFYSSMEQIIKNEEEQYDAVLLLEHDCVPIKQFWLDTFLAEAESEDAFAILGSKYDGDSWNTFRSSLPLALQHHINGNAMYNTTHPLLRKILVQLREERHTPYNAVPYDYRISQMMVEGMLGVKPDLPQKIVQQWQQETGKILKVNSKQFHRWWMEYGSQKPLRESTTIANYASTNLLPHHLEKEKASLIHGAKHYLPWDKNKHNITLVVSDWLDELAFNMLYQIDSTSHPFSKLIVLVPHNLPKKSLENLSQAETKIDVSVERRKNDFFDVCNAQVDTDWFMITNSYHVVSEQVDLLFTKDGKPVIPFTPAKHQNCINFPACREAFEKSKKFDPNNRMIVQDNMIIFNTKERNQFCREWENRYGENRMDIKALDLDESVGTMGPSATTYVSYLSLKGTLYDYYEFTDQTFYGARDNFKRIFTESAEKAANLGETPLANYILQSKSKVQGQMLHMERILQDTAPSFDRTMTPSTLSPTMNFDVTLPPVIKLTRRPTSAIPLFLFGISGSPSVSSMKPSTDPTNLPLSPSTTPSVVTTTKDEEKLTTPTPSSNSQSMSISPSNAPASVIGEENSSTSNPSVSNPASLSIIPSAAPATTPTLTEDEKDKLEEIEACRTWCYLISTPWTSPEVKVFPKCMWKFSCSKCPECNQT